MTSAGKVCSACCEWKPAAEFTRRAASRDGLQGKCKSCRAVYDARRYAANRDELLAQKRRYNATHRDEQGEYNRQYHAAHREAIHERKRAYDAENLGLGREKSRRRRARKFNATIGPVDETAIYERDKVCIYCGSGEDLTVDHIVSLFSGGPHCEDNLVVACRRCNCSKGARPLTEWLETQPYSQAWVL